MHRLTCFTLSHRSFILLLFGFLYAVLIGWFPLFYLPDHLFLLLHYSFCYSLSLVHFLSQQMSFLFFSWFLFIVSSSFLQCFAFLLIPFLNSFSIFIISFLQSVSITLKRSVSLFILSGEFSWSFNWEWFLCFFTVLIFLLLCEFRRKNYLLWSLRAIYMWEPPCVACVGLIFLVQGLFIVWMPIAYFLSVCWLLSPW